MAIMLIIVAFLAYISLMTPKQAASAGGGVARLLNALFWTVAIAAGALALLVL